MRRVSTLSRAGLALGLAGLTLAAGCTHNHYYYGEGVAPAFVVPGESVVVDELCELPSRSFAKDGAVVVAESASEEPSANAGSTDSVADSRAPRVVISRPNSGPIAGRGWSPLGRGDRVVTTEVRGGADESRFR